MQFTLKSAFVLAAIASSGLALPNNDKGATSSTSAVVTTSTSTVSSTSVAPTTVTSGVSATVVPTSRYPGGPCVQYPTGSSWVGTDGTTTSMAPTIYATWAREDGPVSTVIATPAFAPSGTYTSTNGTVTFTHTASTSTNGTATYTYQPTSVPGGTYTSTNGTHTYTHTAYTSTNGTVTYTYQPTPVGTGVTGGAPSGTISTMWPDATNGGVYVNTTRTIYNSGGAPVSTVTQTGWFWPTECYPGPTATSSVGATASVSANSTSEQLKSSVGQNGARSLSGASTLSLGAVAAVVAFAL